jgi:hypothetical protein
LNGWSENQAIDELLVQTNNDWEVFYLSLAKPTTLMVTFSLKSAKSFSIIRKESEQRT